MAANVSALRNTMVLKTRASRSEYIWVVGTYIGGIVHGAFINYTLFPYGGGGSPLHSWLKFAYILFILIWGVALISLSVRRLHDANWSGLWVWPVLFVGPVAFLLVPILCLKTGTPGPNKFGPKPGV